MYYTHNAGWYDVQCEHTVSVDMCIGMAHILNQFVVYLASNGCKVNLVYSRGDLVLTHIRELVDSLCRDGTDTTRPISREEWLRPAKHGSYKPFQTHAQTL